MSIEKFVEFAKSCIDTPFHHQARLPGVGLDCAGLIVVSAQAAGIPIEDMGNYPHIPDGSFVKAVNEQTIPIEFKELRRGDLCLFRFEKEAQHIAIISETSPLTMIHAYAQARKVVENHLDDYWRIRLTGCYRIKGIS